MPVRHDELGHRDPQHGAVGGAQALELPVPCGLRELGVHFGARALEVADHVVHELRLVGVSFSSGLRRRHVSAKPSPVASAW